MLKSAAELRNAAPGYARLLWVDLTNGRHNGSETLYVPLLLAKTLNAARRELFDKRTVPEAWKRACAVQTPPTPDDEADPSTPAPSAPPAPSPAPSPAARPKRRTAAGHPARVISAALITERRKAVEQRTKFTSEEKKNEVKLMDDLLARGETRVVGLKSDWRDRIARMRTDMPNLSKVIDRIEACCALSAFARRPLRIPPLLLVGVPGVGKTHFARSLADLLGVPRFIYALESAETVSVLTGSEKHWGSAECGQLFKLVVQGEFANPVIVLDELDKVSAGNQYKPANALHAVLETATAQLLRDKCIDLSFDASHVVYLATANWLSLIPKSLVSRFELFHIEAPGPRAAVAIARAVGSQVLEELKLTRRFDKPAGEVVQRLALLGSPRRMHKIFVAAVGRASVSGRNHLLTSDLLGDHQRTAQEHASQSKPDERVH